DIANQNKLSLDGRIDRGFILEHYFFPKFVPEPRLAESFASVRKRFINAEGMCLLFHVWAVESHLSSKTHMLREKGTAAADEHIGESRSARRFAPSAGYITKTLTRRGFQ
ncbi:MAG: hypothetical protein ACKPKO_59245, partial [Candidatus Fonsibacter sp.]